MSQVILKRTVLFVTFVLCWAVFAAFVAQGAPSSSSLSSNSLSSNSPSFNSAFYGAPGAGSYASAPDTAGPRGVVPFSGFAPGTIVVRTNERHLYLVLDDHRALRFPVGVGKAGQTWTGKARIEGKYVRPAWSPPDDIRRDQPDLPDVIPGGSPRNPMGDAALTMRGGEYAIHGTNNPRSIGGFVSYGCIRMHNRDIRELYQMVDVGTPVIIEQ